MIKLAKIINESLKDEIEIVPATKEAVTTFVNKHYLHKFPAGVQLIYMVNRKTPEGNIPLGMALYGAPFPTATKFLEPEVKHNETIELKRLFMDDDANKIPNLESFVIGQTLKKVKQDKPNVKVIITFADDEQGHKGTIYQATNAIYLGTSDSGKHKYVYVIRGNLNVIKAKLQTQPYPKKELTEMLAGTADVTVTKSMDDTKYQYSSNIEDIKYDTYFKKVIESYHISSYIAFKDAKQIRQMEEKGELEKPLENYNIWELYFFSYQNGNNQVYPTGMTKYKSIAVYNAIITAIKQFVGYENPAYIVFSHCNDKQKKLYEKLIEKLLERFNYHRILKEPIIGGDLDSDTYMFQRKS